MKKFPGWVAGLYGVFLAIVVILCLSVARDVRGQPAPAPARAIAIVVCGESIGVLVTYTDGNVELYDNLGDAVLVEILQHLKPNKTIGTLRITPPGGCPKPDLVSKL